MLRPLSVVALLAVATGVNAQTTTAPADPPKSPSAAKPESSPAPPVDPSTNQPKKVADPKAPPPAATPTAETPPELPPVPGDPGAVTPTTSAQIIRHYNLFRSVEINGQAAPGVSTGEAVAAMEEIATSVLPRGFASEWTGISLEQKESGGQTLQIFALGILFVFLVLAAQYESFVLPFVIILSVPLAILGGLGLQAARGLANDVFCQVGLVMLVGLASKNAILIVEFAEQLRREGRHPVDAVIAAAAQRLRPILMTSIAFLLGVLPLMLASGAGAGARNSLGTTVFGGMFVSTIVNLVFIPGLYVIFRRGGPRPTTAATTATAPVVDNGSMQDDEPITPLPPARTTPTTNRNVAIADVDDNAPTQPTKKPTLT